MRPSERSAPPPSLPRTRTLAEGEDFRVSEYRCTAGPHDRPFEERHAWATVSVVLEGAFSYRSESGRALLYPGSVLLGNPGSCYECGHEHGIGDRCLAVHVPEPILDEIGYAVARARRFRFPAAMLPPRRTLLSVLVDCWAIGHPAAALADETRAFALVEQTVRHVAGNVPSSATGSARDSIRIGRVLRAVADEPAAHWDLERLATLAAMSKYHFLRTFKRIAGVTPHEFVVTLRLRDAALGLRTREDTVARIALDAGFADLATFNAGFRRTFGTTPRAYRVESRRAATATPVCPRGSGERPWSPRSSRRW